MRLACLAAAALLPVSPAWAEAAWAEGEPGAAELVDSFCAAEDPAVLARLLPELEHRREDCLGVVRERAGAGLASTARARLLRLVGLLGASPEVELAVTLAHPPGEPVDPGMDPALHGTLDAILLRDPAALERLGLVLVSVDAEVAASLVREIEVVDPERLLELLGELLEERAELAPVLLARIGRVAAGSRCAVGDALLGAVRDRLSRPEPETRRQAAFAAGRLGDPEAVGELVEMLDAERHVAEAAHWSLRTLTGLAFPRDAARWRAWLAAEELWYDSSFEDVAEEVFHEDAGRACRALLQLQRHAYRRDRLAAAAAEALASGDPRVRSAACRALASFEVRGTPALLTPLLDDPRPEVAGEARAALLALGAPVETVAADDPGR